MNTHTTIRKPTTAHKGNALQRAYGHRLQMVNLVGIALGVVLIGLLVQVTGDLGHTEALTARLVTLFAATVAGAGIRRWVHLNQRIAALRHAGTLLSR